MSAYSDLILAESALQSYWKLDEASGASSVADSKGVITGTPTSVTFASVPILRNDSADFAGSGNIQFGDNYDFAGGVSYSVEAMISKTVITGGVFMCVVGKAGSTNAGWLLWVKDQSLGFTRHDGSIESSPSIVVPNMAAGRPFHCVAAYDTSDGSVKVYYNGDLVLNVVPTAVTLPNTAFNLRIGNSDGAFWGAFTGQIAHVALYNAVLPPDAVRRHAALALTSLEPDWRPFPDPVLRKAVA